MAASQGVDKRLKQQSRPEPLSTEQVRFFYLHQFNPANPEIYLVTRVDVTGELDHARLTRSLRSLVDNTPLLRTVFSLTEQGPLCQVRDTLSAEISQIDLTGLPEAARQQKAEEILASESAIGAPYSLEEGPLFGLTAVRLKPSEHVLIFRVHHVIMDARSVRLFLIELFERYFGSDLRENPERTEASTDPYTFVKWEAEQLEPALSQERREYWKGKLRSLGKIDLSLDSPRPPRLGQKAGSIQSKMPADIVANLPAECRRRGVTPYVFLLATLNVLLSKLSGQSDMVVGAPGSLRSESEFERMLGVLVNWLIFRTEIKPTENFDDYLLRVRDDAFESYTQQGLPLSDLGKLAGDSERDPRYNPLFQVIFNYVQQEPLPRGASCEFKAQFAPPPATSFDLALYIEQNDAGLAVIFTYHRDLIRLETAEKIAHAYIELVRALLKSGGEKLAAIKLAGNLEGKVPTAPTTVPAPHQLVVAGTFTTEPILDSLEFWMNEVNLKATIEFAPLNQVFQQLLDPSSAFCLNRLGTNVILLRLEDWKEPSKRVPEFVDLLKEYTAQRPSPLVLALCPPSSDRSADPENLKLEKWLLATLHDHPTIHLLNYQELQALYPVECIEDPETDHYGAMPYTPEFYTALGTGLARVIHSLRRPAPKVLVLDCDNTLWTGVVGEDGVEGVGIDEGRRYFQDFMNKQLASGVILCIASKNNESDVWELFERRTDMLLKRENIIAHRINWQPKSANIAAMARELNLGADSFAFFDDSPVECAEVSANCPGTLVFQVPASSAELPSFLKHLWILDERKVTQTDRKRAEMYRQNSHRELLKKTATDLGDFVASLEVKIEYIPLSDNNLQRVSQMTQRTNQFNFTTLRRSEQEILDLRDRGAKFLIVDVTDRFGDYGIVGLVIYEFQGAELRVDTFLLSCRALGRGVEQRIIARLGELAREGGATEIRIPFRVTPKNKPARQMLETTFKDQRTTVDEDASYFYTLSIEKALSTKDRVITVDFESEDDKKSKPALITPDVSAGKWTEIALKLNTVTSIQQGMRKNAASARRRTAGEPAIQPRDKTERDIAAAWMDTLLLDNLGVHDNYFAIGGDSIRSLQIVSKLKKLGYALSPLDVHQYPTVAELAVAAKASTGLAQLVPLSVYEEKFKAREEYPLSFNQNYLIQRYESENRTQGISASGAYHYQYSISLQDLSGPFSVEALTVALEELLGRHPIFRTRLRAKEGSLDFCQVEVPDHGIRIQTRDLTQMTATEQERRLIEAMTEDRGRPFEVLRGEEPPLRVSCLIRSNRSFSLLLSAHHGFCDGWGIQEFLSDWMSLYFAMKSGDKVLVEKSRSSLPVKLTTYREFVGIQQSAATSEPGLRFWKEFASKSNLAARPASLPSPVREQAPGEISVPLDHALLKKAERLAKTASSSLKCVLLANFCAAYHEVVGAEAVIAIVTNGRSEALSEPLKATGLFWSFVPVLATAPVGIFQNTVRKLHSYLLEAEQHSHFRLETMLQRKDPDSLLSASFNFIQFHNDRWRSDPRMAVEKELAFHRFHFPLSADIRVSSDSEGAHLHLSWDGKRFSREKTVAVQEAFLRLLQEASPSIE